MGKSGRGKGCRSKRGKFRVLSKDNWKSFKSRDVFICPGCGNNIQVIISNNGTLSAQKHKNCECSGKSLEKIVSVSRRNKKK
jgi:hypothetical protein